MTRTLHPPSAAFTAAASALLVAAALAVLALLAVPRAVAARCAEPTPIEEAVGIADVVMVGTVTAIADEGTRAEVRVEEIWRAPATAVIDAQMVVWGGPGGRTSVDRQYAAGTRYLFTIAWGEGGRLTDSQCTSTTEWDPKLAALRPAGAIAPLPAGDGTAQPTAGEAAPFDPWSVVGPAAVAIAVALALLGAGLLARGRQAHG